VRNFSEKLVYLFTEVKDKLCSTRILAKNFLKIIYKFEMNFQLRSFGLKEQDELQGILNYVQALFEFSLYIIKNERAYLRSYATGVIAAWG
jgi:hypothetical protein